MTFVLCSIPTQVPLLLPKPSFFRLWPPQNPSLLEKGDRAQGSSPIVPCPPLPPGPVTLCGEEDEEGCQLPIPSLPASHVPSRQNGSRPPRAGSGRAAAMASCSLAQLLAKALGMPGQVNFPVLHRLLQAVLTGTVMSD